MNQNKSDMNFMMNVICKDRIFLSAIKKPGFKNLMPGSGQMNL